jgi:alpha-glucoside transport system substrate-binding protein
MPDRRTVLRAAAAGAAAAVVSGCSGGRLPGFGPTVTVAVTWSGRELAAFRAVLDGLDGLDGLEPGYGVDLIPLGDDISTALGPNVARRPDVVMLPQPGLVRVHQDRLAPLSGVVDVAGWPYADVWKDLLLLPDRRGSGTTKLYGLPFKVAHKSAVWYRRSVFTEHGLRPPALWSEWLELNRVLTEKGKTPLSLAGADGWMLTDFFENVLLGYSPDAYQALTGENRRPLGDEPAVHETLRLLGGMWARHGALSGGATGSLVRQFGDAVVDVFGHGRAAMVVAPDFAEPLVRRFAVSWDDVDVFTFPEVDVDGDDNPVTGRARPLIVGGDVAVLSKGAGPDALDLVKRLTGEAAPLPWIRHTGGFLRAHRNTLVYEDHLHVLKKLASDLSNRPSDMRFDLSDQLAAIGGRGGLWRVLQDFLAAVGGRGDEVDVTAEADRAVRQLTELGR